ncbi:MAG: thioredoxin domain-containing protein [Pirellulales bacterium]|nr:thioredoxin domain-containing protein [Pirellulales bacterium]
MPNRLATETSPYLLQHQNNPVDWYPWGEEALARARGEQKPIFLSVGYSACHWCHVMEHESFENPQIASLMNEHFINIKVDREERPDLDAIYMQAVQILTRRGGWPMSVFLTPDLRPFYGGTYWPPTGRQGMPGFDQVLLAVHDAWINRRAQALEQAAEITSYLQSMAETESPADSATPGGETLRAAGAALARTFDPQHGGFGGAPKFPHPMDLRLLLRLEEASGRGEFLKIVTTTLDKMAAGGIYDHLGGGFHRYSVDERWLVPHFEKMLYDNAQLVLCYIEAFQATCNPAYAGTARETCDYVLREMTDPAGGFYSTEDADSEGVEGKFYVWTPAEVQEILGVEAAEVFCLVYDVSPAGNFEGESILNLRLPLAAFTPRVQMTELELAEQLADSRKKLFAARGTRVRPGLDDKVLVSWNGLMIDALAVAGGVLGEERYLAAARKCADFLWSDLRDSQGKLLHTWRAGQAKLAGYLDDYAALANGLVSLFEATGEVVWLERAVELVEKMQQLFADPAGGYFFTASDQAELLTRHKDLQDNAVPSGNSLAALAFARLASLTGRTEYTTAAQGVFRSAGQLLTRFPTAAGLLLLAVDLANGPTAELVLTGDPQHPDWPLARQAVLRSWHPRRSVVLWPIAALSPTNNAQENAISPLLEPLLAGKTAPATAEGQPTLYICQNYQCSAPLLGFSQIQTHFHR